MGVGATWSTWGARWRGGLNALGCVPWRRLPFDRSLGLHFLFSRGRDAHLPSSSPPRARATDTRSGPSNGPPSGKSDFGYCQKKKAQKKARLGVNEPQIGVWKCLEIPEKLRHGQTEKVRRNFTHLSMFVSRLSVDLSVVARITPPRLAPRGPNLGRASRGATRRATSTRCKRRFSSTAKPEPVARGESPGGVPRAVAAVARLRRGVDVAPNIIIALDCELAPSVRSTFSARVARRSTYARRRDARRRGAVRVAPVQSSARARPEVPCLLRYVASNSVIFSRKFARGPGCLR